MGLQNELPKGMEVPEREKENIVISEEPIKEFLKIINILKENTNINFLGYNVNKDPEKEKTEIMFIIEC